MQEPDSPEPRDPRPLWVAMLIVLGLMGATAVLLTLAINAEARGWLRSVDGSWSNGALAIAGLVALVFLGAATATGALAGRRLTRDAQRRESERAVRPTDPARPRPWGAQVWTWGALLFVLCLGLAVYLGHLRVGAALAMALLGTLTLLFALLFLRAVERGEPPLFESHWGGLGGGLGGWRISPALAYLVALLLFGALVAGLTFQQVPERTGATAEEAPAAEEPAETPEEAGDEEEEPGGAPEEPEAPAPQEDAESTPAEPAAGAEG